MLPAVAFVESEGPGSQAPPTPIPLQASSLTKQSSSRLLWKVCCLLVKQGLRGKESCPSALGICLSTHSGQLCLLHDVLHWISFILAHTYHLPRVPESVKALCSLPLCLKNQMMPFLWASKSRLLFHPVTTGSLSCIFSGGMQPGGSEQKGPDCIVPQSKQYQHKPPACQHVRSDPPCVVPRTLGN